MEVKVEPETVFRRGILSRFQRAYVHTCGKSSSNSGTIPVRQQTPVR